MGVVERLREAVVGDYVSILCRRSLACNGTQRLVKELSGWEEFIVSPNERQFTSKCKECHRMGRVALPPREEAAL